MKYKTLVLAVLFAATTSAGMGTSVSASGKAAKHADGDHAESEEHGDEHAEAEGEKTHGHADEHEGHGEGAEEEEEENSAVGPEKGITKADKKLGFQLSPSAIKTFKLATVPALPGQLMTLPNSAIFFGLQERNIFRAREGFYKRVDFKLISKTKTHSTVDIKDLEAGDLIVTGGLGFLRIAELAASGGGAVGHAH